jgi:DNA-binding GntR family transcriptional regulator
MNGYGRFLSLTAVRHALSVLCQRQKICRQPHRRAFIIYWFHRKYQKVNYLNVLDFLFNIRNLVLRASPERRLARVRFAWLCR